MKKKKVQKTNVIRLLDKENIPYEIHEYPWSEDHLDAKTAAEKVGMPLEKIYKTLVTVGDKTGVTVVCISAIDELDLKALAKFSGNKKIEMLAIKELEKTTGYVRGGCSPLGMKKVFPTFIASQATIMDTIVVSAGKRGMQVELKPENLQRITKAEFVDVTAK